MNRFQTWSSLSLGIIIAAAIVAGCTRTISVVPTTPALVLTVTSTTTSTPGIVPTATPETVQVTINTPAPVASTQAPGAGLVPVLEVSATNSGTSSATMTSLRVTASGNGNDLTGISAVLLYLDTNNNGIVDGGDTLLTSGTYPADDGSVTLNFSDTIAPSSSSHYLVVYNISGSAPAGNYQASLVSNTDVVGTNGSTGSPVLVSGAPVAGAVITVSSAATPTATNSLTNSPTLTTTNTITNTPVPGANTSTATNSPTKSPTPSITNTMTMTATNSATNSPTVTPLVANTATSTPTACTSVNFQPTYTFDAGSIDCWQINGGTSIITSLSTSSTTTRTGAGSLQIAITNTSATTSTAQVELNYTVPQNFTGAAITFYVNVDAGLLDLSTYSTGIAVEDQNSGYTGYEANYTGIGGNSGVWYQIVRNTGIVNGAVIQLGIQLYNIPTGASGNLYIDDIQIALAGAPPTGTPTNSPTVTPTDTPGSTCPLPVAAPYTFDSSIGCWTTVNNFTTSSVLWTAAPPAGSPGGGGALQANVTYPAGQNNEDFEVPLPPGTDLTGKVITFNVYVDSAFGGTYGGMQPYVKETSSTVFCNATWINIPSFNTWNSYQINLSNTCSANATDVEALGIQVFIGGVGAPAAGHVYIDDVTITTASAPTATPTPTGLNWTYEDNTTQYWSAVSGTSGTGDTATVTSVTAWNAAVTQGTNLSTYGLDINFPAIAVLDNSNNDFQVECANTAGGPVIPAGGLDWNALALTSVTVQYSVGGSIGNYKSTLYPYVRAGGGANSYGGTYTGWPGNCNGTCPYVTANTWQTVTFTPSGGSWTTDKTSVLAVGVDINLSGVTPFPGGDVVIDNITLQ